MSLDQEIYRQRRQKLEQLRELGEAPYPHRFERSHALAAIVEQYGAKDAAALEQEKVRVKIAGRVLTLRPHGKAGFAHLQQDDTRLQVYIRQDAVGEHDFAIWKLLDLGDWAGVEGWLFRTRTGELTIHAEKLRLLAKACLPLPEKWHGLQDVERRYRQRYLDLIVNPESRRVFRLRDGVVRSLRAAFHERGYLEVETPMMQPLAGGAAARPFTTHHHALDLTLYLRIAPELYLKRLVVGGYERVFEINRNFRNEGISTRHNPEFTMLEFYEAGSDYRALMEWSEQLLARVAREAAGGEKLQFQGRELNFGAWRRLSLRQAVCEYWPAAAGAAPRLEELADAAAVRRYLDAYNRIAAPGERYSPIDAAQQPSPGEQIVALFEAVAGDELFEPTIIYDFPLAVSPLAKSKDDEPDWVERFEIYAGGLEIANGYSELNDPEEQARRFRLQAEGEAARVDEDYIHALAYGMPPTAGEGIGIDRLVMLLAGAVSIRDVILFPLLRPEGVEREDQE